jgi:hypothetical protein
MAKQESNTAQNANVSPLKSVKTIRQALLEEYRDTLLEYDTLDKKLKDCEARRDQQSDVLCELMKAGRKPERGPLTGHVAVREGARRVTQKLIDENLGEGMYASLLAKATKSKGKEVFAIEKNVTYNG